MKTLTRIVIGVVIVEVILAIYNVPIASLPMIIAASAGALFFMVMGKVIFAIIEDRRHERETWSRATQYQFKPESLRDTISPQIVTRNQPRRLSEVQKGFILAAIQNGAELVEWGADYYAETQQGEMKPLSREEVDYWQMCERMMNGRKLLGGGN